MPNNKFSGISSEKINQSQKEQKKISGQWWKKHRVINWAIVGVFAVSFTIALIVSFFPFYSVKYKLAGSSFDNSMENKIVDDYYKDMEKEGAKLPFKDFDKTKEITDIQKSISDQLSSLSGRYGVYVKDIGSGKSFGVNQDQIFTAASLSKLFVVGEYYHELENNPDLLSSKLTLRNIDRIDGNGSIINDPVGSQYDAKYLIEKMLKESDNTAMAIMTRGVGAESVQEFIDFLGMQNTSFYNNDASPEDIGLFLDKLSMGDLFDQKLADEMMLYMQDTNFEDRLPYYLPEGVRVAHKIGTWDGAYSDAGIVFGEKRKYVIVIMTDGANYEEAVNTIRKISEVVYYYLNE